MLERKKDVCDLVLVNNTFAQKHIFPKKMVSIEFEEDSSRLSNLAMLRFFLLGRYSGSFLFLGLILVMLMYNVYGELFIL